MAAVSLLTQKFNSAYAQKPSALKIITIVAAVEKLTLFSPYDYDDQCCTDENYSYTSLSIVSGLIAAL